MQNSSGKCQYLYRETKEGMLLSQKYWFSATWRSQTVEHHDKTPTKPVLPVSHLRG